MIIWSQSVDAAATEMKIFCACKQTTTIETFFCYSEIKNKILKLLGTPLKIAWSSKFSLQPGKATT